MLLRQGPRPDGSKNQIESAYIDHYDGEDSRYGIVGGFWKGELLGVSAFGVVENPYFRVHSADPSGKRRAYGRVDVVVVLPVYRGFGVGRWVMEASLRYMLMNWPGSLYSLSTVAAHKAIAHILSSYGFDIVSRADSEEEKVSLAIDDEREPALLGMLAERAENNAKRVFFKFRQSEIFSLT
jgi:GNAT superfamily N-acetyltransferase